MPTATLLETIQMYSSFRKPRKQNSLSQELYLKSTVMALGLEGKENTKIGGNLPNGLSIAGLSGGEKRRAAIACALGEYSRAQGVIQNSQLRC